VQIDQVNQQIEELRPYEAIETQKVSMAETVKGLYDSRVLWSAILEEISLVIPDTVSLTQMSCTVPSNMLAGSVDASGATEAVGISFSGQAGTFRDVGEFMTRLGLLPQVMNPRLLSATASDATSGEEPFVTFQVEVVLRPFVDSPPVSGVPSVPTPAATTEGM
jgi:Tfp pilus assembly protein PilN